MTSRRRRALHPVAIIARTPSPLDRLTLEVAAARLSPGDAHRAGGGHVCCTMSFVSCCLMAAISAASCPRSSSAGLRRLAVIEACEDCAHPRVCYNCCRLPSVRAQRADGGSPAVGRSAAVSVLPSRFTVPTEVADIAFQNKAVSMPFCATASPQRSSSIAAEPLPLLSP